MKVVDRLRDCAKSYKQPPFGKEVEGTVEVLEDAAEYIRLLSGNEKRDAVFRRCIYEYGTQPQIDMALEEMSELTKALLKWRRTFSVVNGSNVNPVENPNLTKAREDIVDEIADVRIMCRQMEILFQCEDEVENRIDFKVRRQTERLEKWEAEYGRKSI